MSSQISSSIQALTREFDLISHNLANVSTVGYKRQCNSFTQSLKDLESPDLDENGRPLPAQPKTAYDFSQGSFTQTDRPLDVALLGKGFFVIETPEGPLYTRNGKFRLDADGQLTDLSGRYVAGHRGPITIPPTVALAQVNIAEDGHVTADGLPLGQLKLADFQEDENRLAANGMNCFRAPDDLEPKEAKNIIVKQGFQEVSNVRMIEELVDMITVTRLYEANMRFLTSGKDASKALMDVAMS